MPDVRIFSSGRCTRAARCGLHTRGAESPGPGTHFRAGCGAHSVARWNAAGVIRQAVSRCRHSSCGHDAAIATIASLPRLRHASTCTMRSARQPRNMANARPVSGYRSHALHPSLSAVIAVSGDSRSSVRSVTCATFAMSRRLHSTQHGRTQRPQSGTAGGEQATGCRAGGIRARRCRDQPAVRSLKAENTQKRGGGVEMRVGSHVKKKQLGGVGQVRTGAAWRGQGCACASGPS